MAKLIKFGEDGGPKNRTMPDFLLREETAAQIVALMQSRFDRPGPEEMLKILQAAITQITGPLPEPAPPC